MLKQSENPGAPGKDEIDQIIELCPKCECRDLFIRKDFPQKIGLGLVIVAGVAFLVLASFRHTFWIGASVLAVAAMIDAVMYALVPKMTVCYRCRAEFRGPINPQHHGFELAVAEKYRHVAQEDMGTRRQGGKEI